MYVGVKMVNFPAVTYGGLIIVTQDFDVNSDMNSALISTIICRASFIEGEGVQ